MMGGSESIDFLAPVGSRGRTSSSRARTATSRPTSRSRAASRARRSSPRRLTRPRRSRRRACDHRGAGRVPRHRRGGDDEGDAGHEAGRHGRARAPARRRPPGGGEARWPRSAATSGPRPTRRSARPSAPTRGSLGPVGFTGEVLADETLREGQFVSGANRTGWHLRGVEPGATTSRASWTSASRRRATRARTAAARSRSRRRSRSATSSSSAPATRSRSTRRSSTRTAPSSRSSWAATGSAPAGSWPPRSSSATTSTGCLAVGARAVRRRGHRRSRPPGPRRWTLGERLAPSWRRRADVLLDDRDRRPGEKFADADLIGARSASPSARRRSRTARSMSSTAPPGRRAGRRRRASSLRSRCG